MHIVSFIRCVHLTKDNRTQKLWAMKKIGKRDILQRNLVGQVFVEREVMGLSNSPYIVSLHCTFQSKVCIVLYKVDLINIMKWQTVIFLHIITLTM